MTDDIKLEKQRQAQKRYYENKLKGQPLSDSLKEAQKRYREKNKEKYNELQRNIMKNYYQRKKEAKISAPQPQEIEVI